MHKGQLLTLLLVLSVPLAATASLDETLKILKKDIKTQIQPTPVYQEIQSSI